MINLECNLTVDDLIIEYMMYKVKNGYDPSFLAAEFMNFLNFFENKMRVEDLLHEKDKLFERFFERKAKSDWPPSIKIGIVEKKLMPHIEMVYSEKNNDYLLKASYKLSDYDRSVINTYNMDNGMGKYDDYKGQTFKIREIIGDYLSNFSKRKIDENMKLDENDLIVGKYIAAEMICEIWDSYIKTQVENHRWPTQCDDINKYLIQNDLAETIGVKSIKNEVIQLYNTISKRIAVLYHQDRNLQISTYSNGYLARANYDLIIEGYEETVGIAFGPYKKSLNIDLSTLTFKESHTIDGIYDCDEDPDVKVTTTKIGDNNVKKLVKDLEKSIQRH